MMVCLKVWVVVVVDRNGRKIYLKNGEETGWVDRWEGERKLIYEGEMENGKSKAERGELRHLFLGYSHLLANPDATKKKVRPP